MSVHNSVEDAVVELVAEIFDNSEARPKHLADDFCDCEQCRLDVICYTLNRTAPAYIVSGRGLAHHERDFEAKVQRQADLVALIHRGIAQVMRVRRHGPRPQTAAEAPAGAAIHLVAISGRLIDGRNFAPITSTEVVLHRAGAVLPMINHNWSNPCRTVAETNGSFMFWPAPLELDAGDEQATSFGTEREVELGLSVDDDRYQRFRHYFSLTGRIDRRGSTKLDLNAMHKLGDLYLVPNE